SPAPGWPGAIVSCPGQIAPPAAGGIPPRRRPSPLCGPRLSPASLLFRRLSPGRPLLRRPRLGGPLRCCLLLRLRPGRLLLRLRSRAPSFCALRLRAPWLCALRSCHRWRQAHLRREDLAAQRPLDQVDGLGGGGEPGPLLAVGG